MLLHLSVFDRDEVRWFSIAEAIPEDCLPMALPAMSAAGPSLQGPLEQLSCILFLHTLAAISSSSPGRGTHSSSSFSFFFFYHSWYPKFYEGGN